MGFWERVKDSLASGVETVKEKTADVTGKTEETAKVLMLQRQISEMEKERNKVFTELGGSYYSLSSSGEKKIFSNSQIMELLDKAKEKDNKVAELRNEIEGIHKTAERKHEEREKQKREEKIREVETKLGEHEAKMDEYKEELERLQSEQ